MPKKTTRIFSIRE